MTLEKVYKNIFCHSLTIIWHMIQLEINVYFGVAAYLKIIIAVVSADKKEVLFYVKNPCCAGKRV